MFFDCANFASQAIHVGGEPEMQEDWYCCKKNSTYLVPTNVGGTIVGFWLIQVRKYPPK